MMSLTGSLGPLPRADAGLALTLEQAALSCDFCPALSADTTLALQLPPALRGHVRAGTRSLWLSPHKKGL